MTNNRLPPITGSGNLKVGIVAVSPQKRRERKPTLATQLKQASKAGVAVKSATVAADGSVTLSFGDPSPRSDSLENPWDEVLRREPH